MMNYKVVLLIQFIGMWVLWLVSLPLRFLGLLLLFLILGTAGFFNSKRELAEFFKDMLMWPWERDLSRDSR
ncbi:MAG: hypothetical protein ACREGC_01875 [Minisyncoccia bacterium]